LDTKVYTYIAVSNPNFETQNKQTSSLLRNQDLQPLMTALEYLLDKEIKQNIIT